MKNNAFVVWVDDEVDSLENIVLKFDETGIAFQGFINTETAVKYIETSYENIDAIVVDGNFYLKEADVDIDTKGRALSSILDCLERIKHKKDIPYFVLSGQLNFRNNEAHVLELRNVSEVFDKLKVDDLSRLCQQVLEAGSTNRDRQIINQNRDLFLSIKELPHLEKHRYSLVAILRDLEEDQVDFTAVRKVIESLFVELAEHSIIPHDLVAEKGWINGTSWFLSGKHQDYEYDQEIIHPFIADTLYRVLQVVQDGSHNEGQLRLRVDEYAKSHRSMYFNKSIAFSFLELIIYFSKYIKANQDHKINQSRWQKRQNENVGDGLIEATLLSINQQGWGVIKCVDGREVNVRPVDIEKYGLFEGDKIGVFLEYKKDKDKYHIKTVSKHLDGNRYPST